jgi:hypothetical protein
VETFGIIATDLEAAELISTYGYVGGSNDQDRLPLPESDSKPKGIGGGGVGTDTEQSNVGDDRTVTVVVRAF